MDVVCAYCRRGMTVEEAESHGCDPLNAIVVDVENCRARLVKLVPAAGLFPGGLRCARLRPQPPADMLERAVVEAGGALNISGHYPISREIEEWLAGIGHMARWT